ncbi:MAG: hypothetical protein IPI35_29585 [Deltaproteobacteria bacterium]|nr:hypothetical protein [Deltaproteobacteria bacterium]
MEETLVDDASYWRDRLTKADLPWLHPDIPPAIALDAGAQRASEVIEERRTSWRPVPQSDVLRLCRNRQAHLEHDAFIHGVARLLAQANPDAAVPERERIQGAARLELVACGQISAGLICPTFGVTEPVGVEDVACLLDDEETPRVWVASDNLDAVALELGRALVRRLKEAQFVDVDEVNEASLEAILRCSAEQVERTLNQRRVPSLVQHFEAPEYNDADETDVSQHDGGEEDGVEYDHDEGAIEETHGDSRSSSGLHKPTRFFGLESGSAEVRPVGPSAPAAPGRREDAASGARVSAPPSGFVSHDFTIRSANGRRWAPATQATQDPAEPLS